MKTSVPASAAGRASLPLRALLLEDNPRDAELCMLELRNAGFELEADAVNSREGFAAKLQSQSYDVILSDYRIPGWNGAEAFRVLQQSGKDIPFILVTATLGEEAAVELIKQGVTDYILKDRLARLPTAVRRALEEKAVREARKGTEEALRRSEARARRLVESNIIGIGIGDLSGKLIDANNEFLKIVCYTSEELLSGELRWDRMTPPEHRETDRQAAEQLSSTGVASPWEKELFRKDGSRVPILIGATTLAADGGVEAVSFILDLSERKMLEQQLRQAQKMEAIGLLSGGIAHDFNNLLSVILGYSEVMLDRVDIDGQTRHQCEEIKRAGERAATLTRQLLAFSRQQVLQPAVLNLNTVVVETEKMLQRLIGEDIDLQTSLDPALGSVKADPGGIGQIIMNLAVNARDAMPKGGKLLIETANADPDEQYALHHPPFVPGRYVCLAVADTGVGMDPETRSRVFEPFFTTKGVGKGTGLGLSSVYGIVKQSGGYIWVYSELGNGSVFKIYLPRVDEPVQRVRPEEVAPSLFRGTETILLVEDEQAVRTLTRHLLEQSGYTVVEASDGSQALEIARQHADPIHLVLTDVVMPGMNGPALAQGLSSIHPEAKVLYTSGYSGNVGSPTGIPAGASLLQKPFARVKLLGKLRELLDQ
jgi:two-component system, cell cycle sensor histidine kinase and response regulator CckA